MALDAPTLHELSCLELTAVLVALAGLLLEAASTAPALSANMPETPAPRGISVGRGGENR